MEANPTWFREVIAVLQGRILKLSATPSVKRTTKVESLAEPEDERQTVHRRAAKVVVHVPNTSDIFEQCGGNGAKVSVQIDSDEMNVKRVVTFLKGVPSAKRLTKNVTCPESVNVYSDRVGQLVTCKSTSGDAVQ